MMALLPVFSSMKIKAAPVDALEVLAGGGHAAIQVARLHGARVIATAGSDAKLARAHELGAHEVIDHHASDFAAEVEVNTPSTSCLLAQQYRQRLVSTS
jgi:NADPH-dependent curcumin reductase CurA